MNGFEKFSNRFTHWLTWIAGIGLMGMLMLTVVDILTNKLLKYPIPGGIEVVGFLGVVITAFSIAYTYEKGGHIHVEFFIDRIPGKMRNYLSVLITFFSILLFILLMWQSILYGIKLQISGEVSMTQQIIFFPFVHAIAFCCIPILFLLFVDLVKSLRKVAKQ